MGPLKKLSRSGTRVCMGLLPSIEASGFQLTPSKPDEIWRKQPLRM
jgi:hypothetical protein